MSRRVTREWGRSSLRGAVRVRRPRRWPAIAGVVGVLVVGVLIGRAMGKSQEVGPTVQEEIEGLDIGGGANYEVDLDEALSGTTVTIPVAESIVLDSTEDIEGEANIAQDTTAVQVSSEALETVLVPISGRHGSGTATSSWVDETFQHVLVATLPDPPEGFFYEAWLIRSRPFNFVSVGRLIQHADDLKWYLLWNGEEDLRDHQKVVVTLEADDGDPAPSNHVLEGVFVQD